MLDGDLTCGGTAAVRAAAIAPLDGLAIDDAAAGRPILVVQANPALDRIEVLDRLVIDGVNRSSEAHAVAGGKGGNVARAARSLGCPVAIYGFVGGDTGALLRRAFRSLGIEDRQTTIAGETRTCTILVERLSRRSTVVNEPGPTVSTADAAALTARLHEDCGPTDLVLLTGSLPRGLDPGFYGRLVETVQERGARAIVDARGDVLREAIASRPWMVKANARELGEALELPLEGAAEGEIASAMRDAARAGSALVITLGARGALGCDSGGAWRVVVPELEAVNPTGAGDLFLAGLAVAFSRGDPLPAALRVGAACAVASVRQILPELPADADLAAIAASVTVEAI